MTTTIERDAGMGQSRLLDGHASPRFPAYITATAVTDDELAAAADAAIQRSGGRGALGPIPAGATVLVLSNEDQDESVMGFLAEAMRRAGASSVTTKHWSELGLPTGTYSAADGWRELSDEHVETVIAKGERVQQDALHRFLERSAQYDCIYAGDAGEGHWKIILGERFKANWMYRRREDLLARYTNFPVQIQRLLERKLIETFGRASAVRITDPEGTDLSWQVSEEEAQLWERGAWIPWHIIGSTIEGVRFAQVRPAMGGNRIGSLARFAPFASRHFPTVNGVVAGTVNHTGFFPHITLEVEAGRITRVTGGAEYGRRLEALIDRFKHVHYPGYPDKGYHYFNDATIGGNPKTFRSMETLWETATPWTGGGNERYRAGVMHFGFGVEHDDPEFIAFGRENRVPIKHMAHVHAYFADYLIRDRATGQWFPVVKDGRLTVLEDPAVRRLASLIADPDDLLDYDWVPAIPGINHPGDYQRDYAQDPVPWIRRDVAGEFGRPVK